MKFSDLIMLTEAKITPEQIEKWAKENSAEWDPDTQILTIDASDFDLNIEEIGAPVMGEIKLKYKNGKLKIINLKEVIDYSYQFWLDQMKEEHWDRLYDEKTFIKQTDFDYILKEIEKTKV